MLIPGIFAIVLVILISRMAERAGVTSTKPLLIVVPIYLVVVFGSQNMITARTPSEIAGAMILGGLFYLVVAVGLYFFALSVIAKEAQKRSPPTDSPPPT